MNHGGARIAREAFVRIWQRSHTHTEAYEAYRAWCVRHDCPTCNVLAFTGKATKLRAKGVTLKRFDGGRSYKSEDNQ